jgi:hypothetical protein
MRWSVGPSAASTSEVSLERHPDATAGIVLVDSAHEEQYRHYAAVSPAIAQHYATQDCRFDRDAFLRAAGRLTSGEHLEWHLDVPRIVLGHKRLSGQPRCCVKFRLPPAHLAGFSSVPTFPVDIRFVIAYSHQVHLSFVLCG